VAAIHERLLDAPLLWRAFLASRLLVLVAGVGAALFMTVHTSAAAASGARALGAVGYPLSAAADRFDAGWYLAIAAHGYGSVSSGGAAFSPLYPILIRALTPIAGSDVLAGMLISLVCFAMALRWLHALTDLELGPRAAEATTLLVCFAPLSFFFSAVYTESLFLMLTVGAVLAARRDRWRLACVLGALATLARPTGILIALLLGAIHLRQRGGPRWSLSWLAALPATLLGLFAVLRLEGYPWLAPLRAEELWGHTTVSPLIGFAAGAWQAVKSLASLATGAPLYHPTLAGPFSIQAESVILFANLCLAGIALACCWRRLPRGYALYAAVAILSVLASPITGEPLKSLDRYLLTTFPLFMVAGEWVARRRLQKVAVGAEALALVFYTASFASWSFVA
jgi:hypothetical protein